MVTPSIGPGIMAPEKPIKNALKNVPQTVRSISNQSLSAVYFPVYDGFRILSSRVKRFSAECVVFLKKSDSFLFCNYLPQFAHA